MKKIFSRLITLLKDLISIIVFVFVYLKNKDRKVVILYHSIGHVEAKDDPYKLNISPKDFEEHLKIISKYKDKIMITFDDGYGNNFENAFALLKKYGLKATFFITTDFIDKKIASGKFSGKSFDQRPLEWEEIKIMDKEGMEFGSHSKTHASIRALSENYMREELVSSKNRIEEILDHRICRFSYPVGSKSTFNEDTGKALKDYGYSFGYINMMGMDNSGTDPFKIKRIRLYTTDGPIRFRLKISGAYNWVDYLLS